MNKSCEKKTTTAHNQNILHVDVLYNMVMILHRIYNSFSLFAMQLNYCNIFLIKISYCPSIYYLKTKIYPKQ
jgi:hypothetical protein